MINNPRIEELEAELEQADRKIAKLEAENVELKFRIKSQQAIYEQRILQIKKELSK